MENTEHLLYFHKHSPLKRYTVGASVLALVLFINIIVKYFFSDFVPMTLFLGPVVIAAWFGGRGVGIFVTLFGAIIENVFYSKMLFNFLYNHTEMIRVLVYLGQGTLISFIFGEIHRIQLKISIREEQLSEALQRERANLIEKEQTLNQLSLIQQQLIDERKKAEEANKLKSLFLAHMSHEIRTPLVSVLGFAELLKEDDLTIENAKVYGSIIERTGNNLLNIINDILDLSKVEAGHLEIEKIPFSVKFLVSEIYSTFLAYSQQKEINFEIIAQEPIPSLIVSDPTRLRQILLNLVGNAIKFTKNGFVRILYRCEEQNLIFEIHDSGIGIPEEQQQQLFENFKQADRSISRLYSGTGLGLSLSKKLAHKLGGDVLLLQSHQNLGSVFQLQIHFESPTAIEIISETQKTNSAVYDVCFPKNKNVLLVDDSVDNQLLVQTMLSRLGLNVTLASNGKEALDQIKNSHFDLILMDMQMPIMDGYTACAHLVEDACRIPIVALTANAMKEDRDRCLQAGCKDYISKPIQKSQLLQVLQQNLSI